MYQLKQEKTLDRLPMEVADWRSFDSTSSMFPLEWKDWEITAWEVNRCPWWLDYPKGERHTCENDLYLEWQASQKGKAVSPSLPALGSASKTKTKKRIAPEELRTKKRLDINIERDDHIGSPDATTSDPTAHDEGMYSDEEVSGELTYIIFLMFLHDTVSIFNLGFVLACH